mmetsp:Transcript_84760/g.274570  ORF Transcript_84760/g.274570 Transcript_84760/m.274570 type:complete len:205 (+) Transcript_84760:434-1048(+)
MAVPQKREECLTVQRPSLATSFRTAWQHQLPHAGPGLLSLQQRHGLIMIPEHGILHWPPGPEALVDGREEVDQGACALCCREELASRPQAHCIRCVAQQEGVRMGPNALAPRHGKAGELGVEGLPLTGCGAEPRDGLCRCLWHLKKSQAVEDEGPEGSTAQALQWQLTVVPAKLRKFLDLTFHQPYTHQATLVISCAEKVPLLC